MSWEALKQAGAFDLLSDFGKSAELQAGIFYWLGRAKNEAKINGTIGAAKGKASQILPDGDDKTITMALPSIRSLIPSLGTEEIFPYSPSLGNPAFRKAWRAWLLHKAGATSGRLDPLVSAPIVVPGITGAIYTVLRLFCDPGESIVVPDKRWENYDNVYEKNLGMKVEPFRFFTGGDFDLEAFLAAVDRAWQGKNKAVALLNFPNNPTGYCPPKTTAKEIIQGIQNFTAKAGKTLVLLLDDAYEGFVYNQDAESRSLFYDIEPSEYLVPIKLDGITKELLWYGARVGCISIGYPQAWLDKADKADIEKELGNKFEFMARSMYSNCNTMAQNVAAKALENPEAVVAERQKAINILAGRYDVFQELLPKIDRNKLNADPFQGGFFCFFNAMGDKAPKPADIADHLLKKYEVGTVPSDGPGIKGIRVAFCGIEEENIPKVVDALAGSAEDLW